MTDDPQLDPIQMARFFALPGAFRLMSAFSRIPPGALRDSVIAHAEVMAVEYDGARAGGAPIPDPLAVMAALAPPVAPAPEQAALPAPNRRGASVEEQVVRMRMQKKTSIEIAESMAGLSRQKVDVILNMARKAGTKFPALPKTKLEGKRFVSDMKELSQTGYGAMRDAAARRGKTVEQWMAARALFVELRRQDRPIHIIAQRTGIDEKTLMGWLYAARSAGIDLPLYTAETDAEFEPVEPETKAPAPRLKLTKGARVFPLLADLNTGVINNMTAAAAKRGMTLTAYAELRENIVRLRQDGMSRGDIAIRTGVDEIFVGNTLTQAKAYGADLPSRQSHG